MNSELISSVAAPVGSVIRLCVLLTCFNRKENTLACLQALQSSSGLEGTVLNAVLMDDGSRDGTAEAVRAQFPWVKVLVNQGPPLFWCRGMHMAFADAISTGYDQYLLLNDDTMLFPGAVAALQACEYGLRLIKSEGPIIVVGSTQDKVTALHTYGGERRLSRVKRTSFTLIPPASVPQCLDTFNGNVVLLPATVVEKLGNLDPVFEHGMGDIDYGLRASRAGVGVWLAAGFHGTCSNNPAAGTFNDSKISWASRWQHLLSRKGLPWRSWLHFTRRHGGFYWPIFFIWPYLRLLSQFRPTIAKTKR
ncbi:glycosyltransferase family 2 protein [Roseateles sp. GG27B]